jgi:hypothetical protein
MCALSAAFLLFSGTAMAQNISGPLSGSLGPGTYYVVGDISVQINDSLLIEAGTTLLLNGDYAFSVFGHLHGTGTEVDSIIFNVNTGTSYWDGIHFINAPSSSSILEYCLVRKSNARGISMIASSPTVRHCTIKDNLASYS